MTIARKDDNPVCAPLPNRASSRVWAETRRAFVFLVFLVVSLPTSGLASPGTDWLKRRAVEPHGVGGCAIQRDAHGRIIRNKAVVRAFQRATGFPRGRQGWVVDHIVALRRGGCDWVSNLQWSTIAESQEKDRWE